MAEIKLTESFTEEVEAFRSAGEEIDAASVLSVSNREFSLPTINAYQERLRKIWHVIVAFKMLTKKDAADMDALAARLKIADKT